MLLRPANASERSGASRIMVLAPIYEVNCWGDLMLLRPANASERSGASRIMVLAPIYEVNCQGDLMLKSSKEPAICDAPLFEFVVSNW